MKIICLGDSFTSGLGVKRHKDSWFALLSEKLKDHGVTMVNKGINGDTTSGMLARFGRDVIDEKPDYVLITGGTNDLIAAGCSNMPKNNYMAMVHQAYHYGITPIIGIEPDIEPERVRNAWANFTDYNKVLSKQGKLRSHLKSMASTFAIPCIDFQDYEPWLKSLSDEAPMTSDGMHLNSKGHEIMAESAFEAFARILKL